MHERVADADAHDVEEVAHGRVDFGGDIDRAFRRRRARWPPGRGKVAADAARDHAPAEQPVAGHRVVQPEEALANPGAVGVRHGEPGVADNHADVRDVVVEALQFEQDGPHVRRRGPEW